MKNLESHAPVLDAAKILDYITNVLEDNGLLKVTIKRKREH